VTAGAIQEKIRQGTGLPKLAWDTALVGHPSCNRGTMLATVGSRAVDVLTDRRLYERFLQEFRHVSFDRRDVPRTARAVVRAALASPFWLLRGGTFLARKLWAVRRELLRGEPIGKITFFVHDFMDADALDPERLRNCGFMIMTDRGPVSMCEHNARRDEFILAPVRLPGTPGSSFDPRSGSIVTARTGT
jgi:hypothetical protein